MLAVAATVSETLPPTAPPVNAAGWVLTVGPPTTANAAGAKARANVSERRRTELTPTSERNKNVQRRATNRNATKAAEKCMSKLGEVGGAEPLRTSGKIARSVRGAERAGECGAKQPGKY